MNADVLTTEQPMDCGVDYAVAQNASLDAGDGDRAPHRTGGGDSRATPQRFAVVNRGLVAHPVISIVI